MKTISLIGGTNATDNMVFHTDNDIKQAWSLKYGKISTISFMIYGDLGERDNLIVNHAIKEQLGIKKFAQIWEDVDVEMAELFGVYQGTCIQWIFPSEIDTDEVVHLISEGFEHYRIKHELMGATVDVYSRTT